MQRWFAVMLVLQACDGVFGLRRLPPPPPDAPPATILECTASPIIVRPNGIATTSWTDQYPTTGSHLDQISESAADDDLSYIASAADGQMDLFTHLPIASTVTIDSVTVWVRARIEGTVASAQAGPAFRTPSRLEWDDVVVSSSWNDFSSGTYGTNPGTTQPWTVDEVNALTFGVRKAYSTERARVTQIWATVECR